jgi:phenylpyruvate tautomerase PptA (4-oxalocrotonate tautomerase family)
MPLVRISLRAGKSAEYRRAVADGVHQAMVETIQVPPLDRFQVITEHAVEDMIFDLNYQVETPRTADVVFIQIVLNNTRTVEQKRGLYKRIVERLVQNPGLQPQDVIINLVPVGKEDWSFGNGIAQYAPEPIQQV